MNPSHTYQSPLRPQDLVSRLFQQMENQIQRQQTGWTFAYHGPTTRTIQGKPYLVYTGVKTPVITPPDTDEREAEQPLFKLSIPAPPDAAYTSYPLIIRRETTPGNQLTLDQLLNMIERSLTLHEGKSLLHVTPAYTHLVMRDTHTLGFNVHVDTRVAELADRAETSRAVIPGTYSLFKAHTLPRFALTPESIGLFISFPRGYLAAAVPIPQPSDENSLSLKLKPLIEHVFKRAKETPYRKRPVTLLLPQEASIFLARQGMPERLAKLLGPLMEPLERYSLKQLHGVRTISYEQPGMARYDILYPEKRLVQLTSETHLPVLKDIIYLPRQLIEGRDQTLR